jgi:uncharacterized protein YhdP
MALFALTLDMSVSIGNVLSAATTVVAIVAAYIKVRERLAAIETMLGPLWREFERRRVRG